MENNLATTTFEECYSSFEGLPSKLNEVYISKSERINQLVILFPGDVQECYKEMMLRRDTRYKEFCYENCTKWLHQVFNDSCIFVVKPSRMHLHTFACYEHFLDTNDVGMPNYKTEDKPKAWLHLRALLQSCTSKYDADKTWNDKPISLVSFSKGCIVLNQLVLELPLLVETQKQSLLTNIQTFCWLDGGVPGNSGAYPRNEKCIELLSKYVPNIEVHTTPYQMKDPLRVWISKEKKRFVQLLKKYKAGLIDCSYFENGVPDLNMHFNLIHSFRR
eukprot:TCONS_00068781-protein